MLEKLKRLHFWALCFLMPANLYLIFFYAPVERTMGVVQKVFYVHVACAWIGMLAFVVVFAASIRYLRGMKSAVASPLLQLKLGRFSYHASC